MTTMTARCIGALAGPERLAAQQLRRRAPRQFGFMPVLRRPCRRRRRGRPESGEQAAPVRASPGLRLSPKCVTCAIGAGRQG